MSWKDRIENSKYKITTGDGVEFFPSWRYASSMETEFNTTGFDYIEKRGTFVERKEVKSSKFPLEFYFEGDDCLDNADAFSSSAENKAFWIIEHPLYGQRKGHPVSIERVDENLNIVAFKVDFWETTLDCELVVKVDPKTFINTKNESLNELAPELELEPIEQSKFKVFVEKIRSTNTSFIDSTFYPDFMKQFAETMNAVDDIIAYPAKGIADIRTLINFPSTLNQSFAIRFKMLGYILNDIKELFPAVNRNNKVIFSYLGGAVIGAICDTVTNPNEGDFMRISEIQDTFNKIIEIYSEYEAVLDATQSSFVDVRQEFAADFDLLFTVNEIVQNTLYYLNSMVFDAKQERTIELEKDSNMILLTHKYFGLDKEDKNLTTFRELNNIVNKKLFKIRKGAKIKYLV